MKITFNDFDEGVEQLSRCIVENKVNEMSISYDRGRIEICLNGEVIFSDMSGASDFSIDMEFTK